jgi:asparagine synthetase B (glutamine-hydrolysing)
VSAIFVDMFSPFLSSGCLFQVNGEIYNNDELKAKFKTREVQTGNDCEVVAHLVRYIFIPF